MCLCLAIALPSHEHRKYIFFGNNNIIIYFLCIHTIIFLDFAGYLMGEVYICSK